MAAQQEMLGLLTGQPKDRNTGERERETERAVSVVAAALLAALLADAHGAAEGIRAPLGYWCGTSGAIRANTSRGLGRRPSRGLGGGTSLECRFHSTRVGVSAHRADRAASHMVGDK